MVVLGGYLGVIEPLEPDISRTWMEVPHALFWTAMALCEAGEEIGLDTTVQIFNTLPNIGGFNLRLQFAGAGDSICLDSFLPWKEQEHFAPGGTYAGNLALALATAERSDDVKRLLGLGETRSKWEAPNINYVNSGKRLAWALALCGCFEESFDYIRLIQHPEERFRALFRVTEVLRE